MEVVTLLMFLLFNGWFLLSYGFLNIEELQEMRYALDILHKPISSAEVGFYNLNIVVYNDY